MRVAAVVLVLAGVAVAQGRGNRVENKAIAGLVVHEIRKTVVVVKVLENSPAARAGLRAGDHIRQVGERSIARHNDIDRAIEGLEPGAKLKVVYERESERKTVELTLVARRGFKSDLLKGPGRNRVGYKAPAWSAFSWVNVPKGKRKPTLANSRGKVVVFHCFQTW